MNRREWLRSTAGLVSLQFLGCREIDSLEFKANVVKPDQERRPRVVAIVPESDDEKIHLGTFLGRFLNDAWPIDLALLSIADLVCSTRARVLEVEPGVRSLEDASFVILMPRANSPELARVTEIPHLELDLKTDLIQQLFGMEPEIPKEREPEDGEHQPYHRAISRFHREHLPRAVPRLAEIQKRTAKGSLLRELENAAFDPRELADDDLDSVSAILLERLPSLNQRDVDRTRSALANLTRRRVVLKPPSGAAWMSRHGCGFAEEGKEESAPGVLCGTGFTNPPTFRFLKFLTAT